MATIRNMTNVSQYTIVSQRILMDKALSLKERGLLVTMLSLPDGWTFSIKGMTKILPDGTEAISNTLNNLQDKGYVYSTQSKNANGRFGKNELEVYDYPAKPRKKDPCKGKPYTEKPYTVVTDTDETLTDTQKQFNTQLESTTNQLNIQTTTDDVVDVALKNLFDGIGLSDKDVQSIIKTAKGDTLKIKQAINYYKRYRKPINNVTGFLIEAIVEEYADVPGSNESIQTNKNASTYDESLLQRLIEEEGEYDGNLK